MKKMTLLSGMVVGLSLQADLSWSEPMSSLFDFDPAVKSKFDSNFPRSSSLKEWDISLDLNQIESSQEKITINLPGVDEALVFEQKAFNTISKSHTQWFGESYSSSGEKIGYVIINSIEDRPQAIISTLKGNFEIYTDSRVGVRLALIDNHSFLKHDAISQEVNDHSEAIVDYLAEKTPDSIGLNNSSTESIVEVLVLYDDSINIGTQAINDYLDVAEANANLVMDNSGVPITISIKAIDTITVPDQYEKIISDFGSFNYLSGSNRSKESIEIKQKLISTGADFVAVFTDFDPEPGVVGNGLNEVCGAAFVPQINSVSNDLNYAMTLNSIRCTQSQFVFIHELVHAFGSRHDDTEADAFTPYARGHNIPSSDSISGNIFATMMGGCNGDYNSSPDPSLTSCLREPYLSDPHNIIDGANMGVLNVSDNTRFLSECDTQNNVPCRREQLADRQSLNALINMKPVIEVTNAPNNINETNSFMFTAEIFDDGNYSVEWEIIDIFNIANQAGIVIQSGSGNPIDSSFEATVFANVADDVANGVLRSNVFKVQATVDDGVNPVHSDQIIITVLPAVNQDPEITVAKTTWKHHYAIELNGTDFPLDAAVEVREQNASNQILQTYDGNLIYNRNDHPDNGLNRLIFPIVDPSQQALLRGPGLCFTVVSGSLRSNELCATRPGGISDQEDYLGAPVLSYDSSQDKHFDAFIVKGGGQVLKLHGNNWKKVAYTHDITANTILKIDFKSTHQEPEVAGVGFVMNDGSGGALSDRFWQFFGTDNFGRQELNNYTGTATKSYSIPVGQFLTGELSHLVFITDEDSRVGHNTVFSYPELRLQGADQYDDVVGGPRNFNDDANGRGKLWTDFGANDVIHNLHDQGDVDWTIIHAEDFTVRTELIGTDITPRISLYKWISATPDQQLGYYTFVNDFLVDHSDDSWNTPLINWDTEASSYAVKVESLSGQFGPETEYQLIFEGVSSSSPDPYENITVYGDDNESSPVFWQGATDIIHYKTFHDNNDVDYVLVYTPRFNAEAVAIGPHADIKMTAYRWDDAQQLANGAFINIVKQEVGRDWSPGNSFISVNTNQPDTYVIKIESRNGAFGNGTNYSLRLW